MDIEPKSLNVPLHQEPGPWRKIGFASFLIALVLLLALSGTIVDALIHLLLMLPLLASRTIHRWVGRRGVVGVMLFFVVAVLYSRLIRAVLLPGIKDVLATLSA